QERLFGQFEEGLFAIYVAPFGEGLGTEQVGGNYYTRGEMTFTTYEGQLPRLVLEMGAFGLAGFLLICAGAVMALQCAKKYAAGRGNQAALLATQLLLVSMFAANIVFNHVASALVWMIFAAVLAWCGGQPPPIEDVAEN